MTSTIKIQSTIRLFKAVPVTVKGSKKVPKAILEATLRKGFIFAPEVVANYGLEELKELIKVVDKEYCLSAQQMNSSFHKSWAKVKDSSDEQLFLEQMMHYLTTYGFESLGIYNESSVYIPNENLDIPSLKGESIDLMVIHGFTKPELKSKVFNLLQSGIALKEETMKDVIEVSRFVGFDKTEIESVKNKEVKVALYSYLELVPENPTEFLRLVIYKSVDKTLIIKSKSLIEELKSKDNIIINALFHHYKKEYGLDKLAPIFYRMKPLFLALRTNPQMKAYINKIRRLARKYHKPMPEDYLNAVTAKIKNGDTIDRTELVNQLNKINTFRKVRLLYALKYRTQDVDSIMYKVRNGKGWAESFEFKNKSGAERVYKIVLESVIQAISENVKGKKIYVPENMTYTLPATEKQFTGNFPSGSYISIPKDMVFGIHWEDVGSNRIDLDLSLINATDGKIGWDSNYRTEDRTILFSGDVTDAPKPKGASELFYVKKQGLGSHIMLVNYFNYNSKIDVPFSIIVAKEQVSNLKRNYVVDPNNVMAVAKSVINQTQKVLGLVVTTTNENRFYFSETYLGKSITSSGKGFVDNSRKYLFNFYKNTVNLNKILVKAGAELVKDKTGCDIDLSPAQLEKDTIINLIK